MEAEVLKVNDPALKAVRYAVLGKVYRDMNEKKSQEFFKKALGQPELLARHTSAEYVPLTLKGVDGSSFNNDLLHSHRIRGRQQGGVSAAVHLL